MFEFYCQQIVEELIAAPDKDWVEAMVGSQNSERLKVAAGLAIADFLSLMQQELEATGLSAKDLSQFTESVKQFIHNRSVQETLGNIFTQTAPEIETDRLASTWETLKLLPLPEDFNWQEGRYGVSRQMQSDRLRFRICRTFRKTQYSRRFNPG